jgi:hypothetical protein
MKRFPENSPEFWCVLSSFFYHNTSLVMPTVFPTSCLVMLLPQTKLSPISSFANLLIIFQRISAFIRCPMISSHGWHQRWRNRRHFVWCPRILQQKKTVLGSDGSFISGKFPSLTTPSLSPSSRSPLPHCHWLPQSMKERRLLLLTNHASAGTKRCLRSRWLVSIGIPASRQA